MAIIVSLILFFGISIGHFTFLCHHTNVIYEYGAKLGLKKLLDLDYYQEWRKQPANSSYYYPVFLRERKDSFGSRMVGCPYCMATFLSLITGPFVFVTGAIACLVWAGERSLYSYINNSQT